MDFNIVLIVLGLGVEALGFYIVRIIAAGSERDDARSLETDRANREERRQGKELVAYKEND